MPIEQGYDSQVMPTRAPGPVSVDPEAFGAGVGRQLTALGNAAHQNEIRAFEIQRRQTADAEAADAAHKLVLGRVDLDKKILDMRTNSQPGGAGHPEAVRQVVQDQYAGVLEGITDDAVRRRVQGQIDEYTASLTDRELVWAEGERVGKVLADTKSFIDTSANRIRTSPDDKAYGDELKAGYSYIDSLNVDPGTKDKLRREIDQTYAVSHVQGMFDRGQATIAKSLIQSGAFNGVLDPRQIEALQNGADVEIRRDAAMQQQQNAAAIAGAREQVATWSAKAGNGLVLSEGEVQQAAALRDKFTAAGDTTTAEKLNGLIADNVFARQYEGQLPAQMENRLAALRGKAGASEADQREAAWLQGQVKTRAEQYRADSKGFFIRYGGPQTVPPPLDLGDPQSIGATVDWSRKMRAATGAPVNLLTREQAESLGQAARQGGQNRMSVLTMLDRFPDEERDQVAQQVLPGDAGFRQEAQLHPEARAFVYEGRNVLKGNARFLTPDKDTGANAKTLIGIHDSEMEFALRLIPAADRNAIKQSSGEWLAGWLSKHGRDVNGLTPWDIRQAATYALGGGFERGTRQKGGIGHWTGGQAYAVPDTMSELDFMHAVERDRQARERNGEGPAMSLRNAYPVWLGGNRYRWETAAGRAVIDAKGHDYISTLVAGQ